MKRLVCAAIACAALGLTGCSPESPDDPQVGGESHFLTCDASKPCSDGQCICGVCTVACEDGCTDGEVCLASDDTCPVALCAPRTTCEIGDCPQGLACQDGTCRNSTQYACDGAIEQVPLEGGSTWLRGLLPAALHADCQFEGIDGPFCDADPGAVFGVVVDGKTDGWCVPTDLADAPIEDDGIALRTNDAVRLKPGSHAIAGGSIEGSRVVVFGASAEETALDGPLQIEGSQARLVGLTIDGDLHIAASANGAVLIDVAIRGDLTAEANNVALINTEVHGGTTITGNNVSFVASGFMSAPELATDPSVCVGSHRMGTSAAESVCPQ